MADPQVTVDIGGAVSAGLSAITAVQGLLTGSRSATIEIDNNTGLTLNYFSTGHSSGGYATKFPDTVIKPMSATVFGSQNKGGSLLTGAVGWITYYASEASLWLWVSWGNPYIGSNSGAARLGWGQADQYMVRYQVGDGNTLAPFRFILLPNPGSAWPQVKDITEGTFL